MCQNGSPQQLKLTTTREWKRERVTSTTPFNNCNNTPVFDMHYVNNKECKYCRFLKKQKETKLQVQLKLAHLRVFVFVFEGFTS